MTEARTMAGQALRLQWGALELVLRALLITGRISAVRFWGWLRVHAYRGRVHARRALSRYMKKRKVARVRRLVLFFSLVTLLGVIAGRPGALVTVTAAVGLIGITAARLAPGKVLKADTRKLAERMYGSRD